MKSLSKIDFFNGYFKILTESRVEYVILHTYLDYPERIHSDVDYCVRDTDLLPVLSLVKAYCESSGWRLVQIMQHEVKAYFCVCVSKDNPSDNMQLDVCSHYMREGKLLIDCSILLHNRRIYKNKGFYVPDPIIEFTYIMWKAAAKSKTVDSIDVRVHQLLNGTKGLSFERGVKQSLSYLDIHSEVTNLPSLLGELVSKYERMSLFSVFGEVKRRLHRIRYPSGVFLIVEIEQYEESRFADMLLDECKFPFRLFAEIDDIGIKEYLRVMRSTLLLSSFKPSILITIVNRLLQCEYRAKERNVEDVVDGLYSMLEKRTARQWRLNF